MSGNNSSTGSEGLGRREIRRPEYLGIYDTSSSEPLQQITKESRGHNGGARGGTIQKSTNRFEGSDDNQSDESMDGYMDVMEMISENSETIKNNTQRIESQMENVITVLKTIMGVLPLTEVQNIASEIRNVTDLNYIWTQDIVRQTLDDRKVTPEQGKNNSVNNVLDTSTANVGAAALASKQAAAVAATTATRSYASAVTNVPNDLDSFIKQKINENIEEINRKKVL